jgi:uncharacterized protein (TIGR02246 family)
MIGKAMDDTEAVAIVRRAQQRLEDAWRAGSGQGFADACAEDADFINLVGIYLQGRPAIAEVHQSIFDGMYAGSIMTLYTERARFLADRVIQAQMSTKVEAPSGALRGVVHGIITMVLARIGDEWLITCFQNTRREGSTADGAQILAAMGRD